VQRRPHQIYPNRLISCHFYFYSPSNPCLYLAAFTASLMFGGRSKIGSGGNFPLLVSRLDFSRKGQRTRSTCRPLERRDPRAKSVTPTRSRTLPRSTPALPLDGTDLIRRLPPSRRKHTIRVLHALHAHWSTSLCYRLAFESNSFQNYIYFFILAPS
jgi:hypothetical protein